MAEGRENHTAIFGRHDVITGTPGNSKRQSDCRNYYCPFFHPVILIWPTYDNSLFINRRYIS